jgi:hypothetical protein
MSTLSVKATEEALSNVIDILSRGVLPDQVLRELVKNATEAIERGGFLSEENPGVVRIARDKKYPNKAVITNTAGDPLTQEVAKNSLASIGATGNDPDENFGIGAKIAYLPQHPLGLEYRSRQDNESFTIHKDERNIYGLKEEQFDDDHPAVFLDCPDEDFTFDDTETEVVLKGKTPGDDTWRELCRVASKDQSPSFSGWTIRDHLNTRFWEPPLLIDTEVCIYDEDGNYAETAKCRFLKAVAESKEVHGTVPVTTGPYAGVKMHYYALKTERGKKKATHDIGGYFGYIHNNEVFIQKDITGTQRKRTMENAGVLVSHKNVLIVAEMPDSMGLLPLPSRAGCVTSDGTTAESMLGDIGNIFRENMPSNLKEWMHDNYVQPTSDVKKEAEKLYRRRASATGAANPSSHGAAATGGSRGKPRGPGNSTGSNAGKAANGKRRQRKARGGAKNKAGSAPDFRVANEGASEPVASFPLGAYTITVNLDSPLLQRHVSDLTTGYPGIPLENLAAEETYLQICSYHATLLDEYGSSESDDKIEARMESDKLNAIAGPIMAAVLKLRVQKASRANERAEALIIEEEIV